jgi:hypothetical protein
MTEKHKIKATPLEGELLGRLWASAVPLTGDLLLEAVNRERHRNGEKLLDPNVFRVTLQSLRDKLLVCYFAPGKFDEELIDPKAIANLLKSRSPKTAIHYRGIDHTRVDVSVEIVIPTPVEFQKRIDAGEKEITKRFNENFPDDEIGVSLAAVYQKPLAYTESMDAGPPRTTTRTVCNLWETTQAWLDDDTVKEDARIRLLAGDAGTGKSSFTVAFGQHVIESRELANRYRVVHVMLHHLNVRLPARKAIAEYASKPESYCPGDLLDPIGPNDFKLLLLLDGIDELARHGDAGNDAARAFVDSLAAAVAEIPAGRRIRVLVCGRPISVQEATRDTRRSVYHLIPYLPENEKPDEFVYADPNRLLEKHDQRQDWWTAYARAMATRQFEGEPIVDQLPETLGKEEKLEEFTAIPLMLWLLATAYRQRDFQKPGLPPNPFTKDGKLPQHLGFVLDWLIGYVHLREKERALAANGGGASWLVNRLEAADFARLLGAIGLAAVHTGTARRVQYGKVKQVGEWLDLADLLDTLDAFCRGDRGQLGRVSSVFVLFHLRYGGTVGGEPSFEFTIKPFAEYLAARALVDWLAYAGDRWQAVRSSGETKKTQVVDELLLSLVRLAGPLVLTDELLGHLVGEVERREVVDRIGDFADRGRAVLIALVNRAQPRKTEKGRVGLPVDGLGLSTLDAMTVAERSAQLLESLKHACGARLASHFPIRKGDVPSSEAIEHWKNRCAMPIAWERDGDRVNRLAASEWLRLLRKADAGFGGYPTPLFWCGVDLQGQYLQLANLRSANLVSANLRSANLFSADLVSANLVSANLFSADLRAADLFSANLVSANLFSADLFSADLRAADLRSANLVSANLRSANLVSANLVSANLRSANLFSADLVSANLRSADLRSASLVSANLRSADLRSATSGDYKLDTAKGRKFLRNAGAIIDDE